MVALPQELMSHTCHYKSDCAEVRDPACLALARSGHTQLGNASLSQFKIFLASNPDGLILLKPSEFLSHGNVR